MAEFVEVMKQKKRMCEYYEYCVNCPIMGIRKRTEFCESPANMTNPKEAEKIIMDWAKEHPIISNTDKFFQIVQENFSTSIALYFRDRVIEKFSEDYLKDFWEQEWKEPKEEADE